MARRSIIVRIALLGAMVYLIVTMSGLYSELSLKQQELKALTLENEMAELQNQELRNLVENGSESDYIERAARDRLGYVYANEEVFTDISGK